VQVTNDDAGGFAAMVGTALFGGAVLVATVAGFVILFKLKRPVTDPTVRVARLVLVGAGVLGAMGLAVFAWAVMAGA
jgi:energy-converting hydrogenase Eha subunit H